ncbi:MAG: STAS domain-containing protein [Verrucomicrobiales bacterium]|nr:STAS domain-containing protein [Verrucomicrobiales bacterium]
MNNPSRILVADIKGTTWLRISGKGSFQNSPDLKAYTSEAITAGHHNTFVIDLEDCTGMDSTFMGTLTGIALKLGDDGSVHVINANTRNQQLLENLGLDQIFKLDTDGSSWKTERNTVTTMLRTAGSNADLPNAELDKTGRAQHVLEAHEALGDASDDNIVRFKDVVDFFRKDLEEGTGSAR